MKKLLLFTATVIILMLLCSCKAKIDPIPDQTDRATEKIDIADDSEIPFSDISKGRFLMAKDSPMLICEIGPTVMVNKSENPDIFASLSDGDLIKVTHTEVRESYPASTDVYKIEKLEEGSITDISEEVLLSLSELGWYDAEGDSGTPPEHTPTDPEPEPIELSWSANDLEEGFYSDREIDGTQIELINSIDDLHAYWESLKNEYVIFEPCTTYDESFFEENYLVIIYRYAHSGSVTRTVKDVSYDGGKLQVTIEEYCPPVFTDDCSGWTHFIEVPREFQVPSKDSIDVNYHVIDSFSYDDDMFFLGDNKDALITKGFVNTAENPITDEEDAVDLALNEFNYGYDTVAPYYDKYSDVWKVSIYHKNMIEDSLRTDVYLSSSGITLAMITYDEDTLIC